MAVVLTWVHPTTRTQCVHLYLICTMQTWPSDLVMLCPSVERRTTSLSWGERLVLGMVVVIGCSVMIAFGQLPWEVQ